MVLLVHLRIALACICLLSLPYPGSCVKSDDPAIFYPVAYHLGSSPALDNLTNYSADNELQLTPFQPSLTLDYGTEAGGFPYIDVGSISPSGVQLQFKYSEQWNGLNQPQGDGPFPFAVALSNTYRAETFNITESGRLESFLLQGGLRWQSLELLTSDPESHISIREAGIRATVPKVPIDQLPGRFKSSNDLHTEVWNLGARTVQSLCLEAGSQPSTWELSTDGALIRGQQTGLSAEGVHMGNYTMTFKSLIVRGGLGWRVASRSYPFGPYFVLTSEYPEGSTFINTNRTLMPPNSLIVGFGTSLVNQTTLTSSPVQYFPLSTNMSENIWHEISTAITTDGFKISVDEKTIVTLPFDLAEAWSAPYGAPELVTDGTWGFGPWQDQVAYYTNVTVTASNGTLLYSNDLTKPEILPEYGVHSNYHSFCSDRAKRDRLVWIGVDFTHAMRAIVASTNRLDFVTGTIDAAFAWQHPITGLIAVDAEMGALADYRTSYVDAYGITDWQLFFLMQIGQYYQLTGDTTHIAKYWSQLKVLVSALLKNQDPYSGLMAGQGLYFFPAANGTVPTSVTIIGLKLLVKIAQALQDNETAVVWASTAESMGKAINTLLWNDDLGIYALAVDQPGNYSVMSASLPIRAGIANATQAQRSIALMNSTLRVGPAFKDFNTVVTSSKTQLSPNINGWLVEALFLAHQRFNLDVLGIARDVLEDLWVLMVTQNEYYTGTTWEYVYPDGAPGLDFYTAHSHEWGTAPTYVLSDYVLGITPAEPGFKSWSFRPLLFEAATGQLNTTSAEGVVQTPWGSIEAKWEVSQESEGWGASISARGPKSTIGRLEIGSDSTANCFVGEQLQDCNTLESDSEGVLVATIKL